MKVFGPPHLAVRVVPLEEFLVFCFFLSEAKKNKSCFPPKKGHRAYFWLSTIVSAYLSSNPLVILSLSLSFSFSFSLFSALFFLSFFVPSLFSFFRYFPCSFLLCFFARLASLLFYLEEPKFKLLDFHGLFIFLFVLGGLLVLICLPNAFSLFWILSYLKLQLYSTSIFGFEKAQLKRLLFLVNMGVAKYRFLYSLCFWKCEIWGAIVGLSYVDVPNNTARIGVSED